MFNKKSSIKTDMANRALYGALSAIYYREVIRDISVIDTVVQGAKDLITYGALSCISEVRFYEEFFNKYIGEELGVSFGDALDDLRAIPFSKDSFLLYQEYFDAMIPMYMDGSWKSGMGGMTWAKITIGLKNIALAYMDYTNSTNSTDKINNGNKVIYLMNLFDNLAHNTGSIFEHILDEENYEEIEELGFDDDFVNKEVEAKEQIEYLMHSKNLKNPYDALVIAENNVGISIPFYEKYLQKIRSSKQYGDAKRKNTESEINDIANSKENIAHLTWYLSSLNSFVFVLTSNANLSKEIEVDIKAQSDFKIKGKLRKLEAELGESEDEISKMILSLEDREELMDLTLAITTAKSLLRTIELLIKKINHSLYTKDLYKKNEIQVLIKDIDLIFNNPNILNSINELKEALQTLIQVISI